MIAGHNPFVERSMASSRKHRPSDPPSQADDSEDQSTSVRPAGRRRRRESGVWASRRLEQKLQAAKALLADLPPDHPRARLLRIAIVRKDEVVLDGILQDLNAGGSR